MVIDMVGLQNGIDRLLVGSALVHPCTLLTDASPSSQFHINHKNPKVKESILQIIVHLQEIHGAAALAAAASTALCPKVCSLLSDSQSAVRSAAVDALTKLHDSFGDSLWVRAAYLTVFMLQSMPRA